MKNVGFIQSIIGLDDQKIETGSPNQFDDKKHHGVL